MRYQKETDYILSLLKSAVDGSDAPFPSKDLNWDVIYKIAKRHRIYSILYFSLEKLPNNIKQTIPNLNVYQLAYKKYIVTDTNRSFYWSLLSEDFEANKIDYVLLKGSVSKYLYPEPSMRVMRDMDILYRNAEENTIISIFEKYGFKISKKEPKEISFFNEPLKLAIEVQSKLIDEGYKNWYKYLDNIWDRCVLKEGHEYTMTKEDFYIYHLIHMAKHFVNGGIGINHILDTYIIEKSYIDLNKDYLRKELESLKLLKFYNNICDLINAWFKNCNQADLSEELILLGTYIWESGSFGVRSQQEVNMAVANNNDKISLLKRIFPNSTTMINYYGGPIKNHKWLLPFYWVRLNIDRLKRDKKELKQSVKNISNIDDDRIKKTKQLFDFCGLN